MPKTTTKSVLNIFNVLKFVGGVAIFYFGLKLFVPSTIKEDFVSTNMYEGTEVQSNDMTSDFKDALGKHDVAGVAGDNYDSYEYIPVKESEYEELFQNICMTNRTLCDKIIFNGEYDMQDKYMYLASAIYVLRFIENNIQAGLPISKNLDKILVNDASNTRRGFANWTTVTLNLGSVSSYAEFMELVSHELGHIVDLGLVRGYSFQKDSNYTEFGNIVFSVDDPSISYYEISRDAENIRKSTSVMGDFCSSYGMSDPFEDFAECHNLYLNHNSIFKAWAKNNESMRQKYNFFANLYGGKFLFNSTVDLSKYQTTSSYRPWDTTKM